jgi:hypothetical protein
MVMSRKHKRLAAPTATKRKLGALESEIGHTESSCKRTCESVAGATVADVLDGYAGLWGKILQQGA